jgi:ribosome-binding protein aMBF1 (putative translation factor)
VKLEDLISSEELHEESMQNDPEYRAEWERTRFAHEVAMKVIAYRVEHNLSQTALARRLGMRQPHVSRLEAGDVTPSLDTLQRLSRELGMEFHLDVTPRGLDLSA